MATIFHVLCIILGSLGGFALAWLWRSADLRDEVRRATKALGFMISERDDKIQSMTYARKKAETTIEAQEADLETLRSGFAEAEKMMEDDVRELRQELAGVKRQLRDTESQLQKCLASLEQHEAANGRARSGEGSRGPAIVTSFPAKTKTEGVRAI